MLQKYERYLSFLSETFQFLEIKFSIYLIRRVFLMILLKSTSDCYRPNRSLVSLIAVCCRMPAGLRL